MPEQQSRPISCSPIPRSIIFVVLLLAAAGILPVSADEPACYQVARIDGIYVVNEPNLVINTPVEVSPIISTCDHCYYHWYISKIDPGTGAWIQIAEYFDSSFSTTFTDPGSYKIDLQYGTPKPVCDSDNAAFGTQSKTITVTDPCPAVRSLVEIGQQKDTSVVGETPWWWATSSPSCPGCSFTWSLWKLSGDSWVQYPIGESDVHTENGRPEFSHMFTEPGDYKINARMNNPQGCENAPGQLNYASMSVNHRVTASSGSAEQGTSPQVINPAPLSTTGSSSPTASATPSQQVTQPSVTNTVIPAATQPLVTLPQGTVQPAGTHAPAGTPAGNQMPNSVPVITTIAPAGTAPGSSAPAAGTPAPSAAPTRTPGFGLPLALGACMFVLVMHRK
ncbi:MAG: hypothetical protein GYA23_09345 [Methanomicrobiales archaeon]|nr:hypothetical protein [Methanomicrobiales archaeon]